MQHPLLLIILPHNHCDNPQIPIMISKWPQGQASLCKELPPYYQKTESKQYFAPCSNSQSFQTEQQSKCLGIFTSFSHAALWSCLYFLTCLSHGRQQYVLFFRGPGRHWQYFRACSWVSMPGTCSTLSSQLLSWLYPCLKAGSEEPILQ